MKNLLMISILTLSALTSQARLSSKDCRGSAKNDYDMIVCAKKDLKKAERLLAKATKNVLKSLNDLRENSPQDFRSTSGETKILIQTISRSAAQFHQMTYDTCAINSEAIGGKSFEQDVADCQTAAAKMRTEKLSSMAADYEETEE